MPNHVSIIGTRGYPSFYGGFETAVRKLAPFLVERGWGVSVYSRPGTEPHIEDGVHAPRSFGLAGKKLGTLSHGLSSSLLATTRPTDVALVMNVANGYWLPALKMRSIPTVVNTDGIEWERDKWGPAARKVFKTGARLTAKYADHLVYDSEEIRRKWVADFGRDGFYIPYGSSERANPTQLPAGLEPGKFILWVARLVPENSIRQFVEAIEVLNGRYPVVIAGSSGFDDEYDNMVKLLSTQIPSVIALGHVKDDALLDALWASCGAYFHGHSVGGTNPALVQAMRMGAPTLARDTIYNREVLAEAGLFTAARPNDIVQGLTMLMEDEDLRRSNKSRSVERALERFTWQKVNEAYENVLLEAISRKGQRKRQPRRTLP